MMRRRFRLEALMALLVSSASVAAAQDITVKPFVDAHYYDALRAEPHAARIKILVPAWSSEFPDSLESGSRFAWQITLGRELPILAMSSESLNEGRVGAGKFGVGLWLPVAFHMIEDFKDASSPIVDTDYRFGLMTKFQYGITADVQLGVRFVPWAHESTHLGDEYVLGASRDPEFERVNVSYEYFEYGVSLESDKWTIRHGGLRPWGKDGYYSDHLLGSESPALAASTQNYEPSLGAEYRLSQWRGRRTYLSVDTRWKLQYAFHASSPADETRQWSTNLQLGRTVEEDTGKAPLQDYFVQVYYGVNPYGQLRSQRDHWSAGFGWVFGF